MAAAWSDVAESYSEKVDFFEFDCTADDAGSFCLEDFGVTGFPTLVFLPIETELTKTYIPYEEEEIEAKDLIAFAIEGGYKDKIESRIPIAK